MSKFILNSPHVLAEIYYLTPQEGGRSTAIVTGYRGQIHLNSYDWDAGQEFLDCELCLPGETVIAKLQFATAHDFLDFVVGTKFWVREGVQAVGRGYIKEVFHNNVGEVKRGSDLYRQVDEILWKEWDPLGVNEIPEARDEYYSYIMGIINLLYKGSSANEIAEYLYEVESDTMGMFGNMSSCLKIANLLKSMT
jgi:hypothetical protein